VPPAFSGPTGNPANPTNHKCNGSFPAPHAENIATNHRMVNTIQRSICGEYVA